MANRTNHGGKRPGSGRPKSFLSKRLNGDPIPPASAAEILSLVDERKLWVDFLTGRDKKYRWMALIALTRARDGRPYVAVNPKATIPSLRVTDQRVVNILQVLNQPAMVECVNVPRGTIDNGLTEEPVDEIDALGRERSDTPK